MRGWYGSGLCLNGNTSHQMVHRRLKRSELLVQTEQKLAALAKAPKCKAQDVLAHAAWRLKHGSPEQAQRLDELLNLVCFLLAQMHLPCSSFVAAIPPRYPPSQKGLVMRTEALKATFAIHPGTAFLRLCSHQDFQAVLKPV